jgi:hypothetical protein
MANLFSCKKAVGISTVMMEKVFIGWRKLLRRTMRRPVSIVIGLTAQNCLAVWTFSRMVDQSCRCTE